jgi:hypothetical protein
MSAAPPQQEQTSSATNDDILKPPYEIEPIPTRIGHGFDIHRMAPLEEAGQPIVIGGVVIPHSDQKVSWCSLRSLHAHYESFSNVDLNTKIKILFFHEIHSSVD